MANFNQINIEALKNYKNDYNNEKESYISRFYSQKNNLRDYDEFALKYIIDDIKNSSEEIKKIYENIDNWWSKYISDAENIELFLAEKSSIGIINSDLVRSSLNNINNNYLQYELNNFHDESYVRNAQAGKTNDIKSLIGEKFVGREGLTYVTSNGVITSFKYVDSSGNESKLDLGEKGLKGLFEESGIDSKLVSNITDIAPGDVTFIYMDDGSKFYFYKNKFYKYVDPDGNESEEIPKDAIKSIKYENLDSEKLKKLVGENYKGGSGLEYRVEDNKITGIKYIDTSGNEHVLDLGEKGLKGLLISSGIDPKCINNITDMFIYGSTTYLYMKDGSVYHLYENSFSEYVTPTGEVLNEIPDDVSINKMISGNVKELDNINVIFGNNINSSSSVVNGYIGGNQEDLLKQESEFLKDKKVKEIIGKYYDDVSEEEMDLMFYRMNSSGCAYTAAINTILSQYTGKEKEFKDKFGYDLYTEKTSDTGEKYIDFNSEYLYLELCLYHGKEHEGYNTVDEFLGNTREQKAYEEGAIDGALSTTNFEKTGLAGVYIGDIADTMKDFLTNEKNINFKYEEQWLNNETIDPKILDNIGKNNTSVIVQSYDFNLYYPEDIDGNGLLDDISTADVGSHAMMVVGTTDDENKVVVSSWGELYVMNVEDIKGYTICDYSNEGWVRL